MSEITLNEIESTEVNTKITTTAMTDEDRENEYAILDVIDCFRTKYIRYVDNTSKLIVALEDLESEEFEPFDIIILSTGNNYNLNGRTFIINKDCNIIGYGKAYIYNGGIIVNPDVKFTMENVSISSIQNLSNSKNIEINNNYPKVISTNWHNVANFTGTNDRFLENSYNLSTFQCVGNGCLANSYNILNCSSVKGDVHTETNLACSENVFNMVNGSIANNYTSRNSHNYMNVSNTGNYNSNNTFNLANHDTRNEYVMNNSHNLFNTYNNGNHAMVDSYNIVQGELTGGGDILKNAYNISNTFTNNNFNTDDRNAYNISQSRIYGTGCYHVISSGVKKTNSYASKEAKLEYAISTECNGGYNMQ